MNNLKHYLFGVLSLVIASANGQDVLPKELAPWEQGLMDSYLDSRAGLNRGTTTPPPFSSLRTAAEWEEVQSLVITWTGQYDGIHSQIVDAAQEECEVIIMCADSNDVKNILTSNGVPHTNTRYVETDFNSVWIRDYAANTVYVDDVDSLIMVDWIYNRPRPDDDVIPDAYCALKGLDLYSMTVAPNDIMGTGGNWMSDGFEIGFSSALITDENDGTGDYGLNYPNHTEAEIDALFSSWLGINEYVKMTVLPYDDIHHIDMHMKIIDEETLLVGEFPSGESDGPQIEANIQYVLSNFTTKWGTPFKLVRIPMPPSTGGNYPSGGWNSAYYRTYANQTFVNKTILLPTYREEYDTTALRILGEAMPGYNIVPIDVDDQNENLIGSGGAIHCITHTIGVADPLLISHKPLEDTYDDQNPYTVNALMKHRSGMQAATLYYKTSLLGSYQSVSMSDAGNDTWAGDIPAQAAGTRIYYYVEGESVSGKQLARPIAAPDGYWHFDVLDLSTALEEMSKVEMGDIFPNPASAITAIPVDLGSTLNGELVLINSLGQEVDKLYQGTFSPSKKFYFLDAQRYEPGVYSVVLRGENVLSAQQVVIQH